jgi:hypothetical protein
MVYAFLCSKFKKTKGDNAENPLKSRRKFKKLFIMKNLFVLLFATLFLFSCGVPK